MTYQVIFPTPAYEKQFEKVLLKISKFKVRDQIIRKIEALADNPRPIEAGSFKRLNPPIEIHELTAQYRLRVGDYRILYDVDDYKKTVMILALRKRNEKTYN